MHFSRRELEAGTVHIYIELSTWTTTVFIARKRNRYLYNASYVQDVLVQ